MMSRVEGVPAEEEIIARVVPEVSHEDDGPVPVFVPEVEAR